MTNHLANAISKCHVKNQGKEGLTRCRSGFLVQQRGAVDGPAQRAGDERILYAEAVDEKGGEHAEEAHEAEDERVSPGHDIVFFLGPSIALLGHTCISESKGCRRSAIRITVQLES